MLNDAICFKQIYIVCGLSSAYFYLTPQILANSSSLSIHSAISDISTLLFSIAVFNISIDGSAYIRVV